MTARRTVGACTWWLQRPASSSGSTCRPRTSAPRHRKETAAAVQHLKGHRSRMVCPHSPARSPLPGPDRFAASRSLPTAFMKRSGAGHSRPPEATRPEPRPTSTGPRQRLRRCGSGSGPSPCSHWRRAGEDICIEDVDYLCLPGTERAPTQRRLGIRATTCPCLPWRGRAGAHNVVSKAPGTCHCLHASGGGMPSRETAAHIRASPRRGGWGRALTRGDGSMR